MRLIILTFLFLVSSPVLSIDCKEVREQYNCPGNERYPIHLTFDDGPADLTPKVLDLLKVENIPATFFVLAYKVNCQEFEQQCNSTSSQRQCLALQQCQSRRQTLERMIKEGHLIGSHSYRHDKHTEIPHQQMLNHIKKSKNILQPYLNTSPPLFRLPNGDGWFNRDSKPEPLKAVQDHGFKHLKWEMSAYDWRASDQFGNRILKTVMNEICTKKRGIILFHDGDSEQIHIGRTFTNEHLHTWIPAMRCVAEFKPLNFFYPEIKTHTSKQ